MTPGPGQYSPRQYQLTADTVNTVDGRRYASERTSPALVVPETLRSFNQSSEAKNLTSMTALQELI